jgi:aminopeptidase N
MNFSIIFRMFAYIIEVVSNLLRSIQNASKNSKMNHSLLIKIIIVMFMAIPHAINAQLTDEITQAGVSHLLATNRSKAISNLRYNLSFSIPQQIEAPVKGNVSISLDINSVQPVVIDFKANPSQVISVNANGKKCKATVADEHIIIPASSIKRGSNTIDITFIAGNQSLNRNKEFLYTLLVPDRARTLFPCFDQPNLKAQYNLSLDIPASWVAVANTAVTTETTSADRKKVTFAPTEPLSTYLFSFVAGQFQKESRTHNNRTISAYHRENDPDKIAQLDTIFDQVFYALDWLEEYTAIPYPFAKYDFIILPGFQFGGMEHTGATLYNDRLMFLGNHPTPDEILDRAQLIAHETSHMWFGDLVTMAWFDDVWTKEVFANYYAAEITEPLYPDINHSLNWLRTFYTSSLNEDRTPGTTAIQQPLDNLQDAGLIYGRIIYNKAPVMMLKLVDILGKDIFRQGIRQYLKDFSYANATWDDLINILDSLSTDDLKSFSNAWVKEKGMPTITTTICNNGIDIAQSDAYGRDLIWQQEFKVIAQDAPHSDTIDVNLNSNSIHIDLPYTPTVVIPNSNGRGYGYFKLDSLSLNYLAQHLAEIKPDVTRQALIMTLYENFVNDNFDNQAVLINSFIDALAVEPNELIASYLITKLSSMCFYLEGDLRTSTELRLHNLDSTLTNSSSRLQLQRQLVKLMTAPSIIQDYYTTFSRRNNDLWSENDYTTAAYELAIRYPEKATEILNAQRATITNTDRVVAFDFISRACATSDTTALDSLFNSLLIPENRRVEPHAQALLYYLNHPARDVYSSKYIIPGLNALRQVQLTGDIFFTRYWCENLVSTHRSPLAAKALNDFLDANPEYPQLLKNKILQASTHLLKQSH